MSARAAEPVDAEFQLGEAPLRHRSELRLWLRLLTCANLIEAEIRRRLRARFATTLPRFDLMAQLQRAPDGMLLGEVSRRMMVSNGNVTGLVERLAQEGAIERLASERDRRAVRVRLTPRGRRQFAKLALAHSDWVAALLAGLPVADQAALFDRLGGLKGSVRQATAPQPVPNPVPEPGP